MPPNWKTQPGHPGFSTPPSAEQSWGDTSSGLGAGWLCQQSFPLELMISSGVGLTIWSRMKHNGAVLFPMLVLAHPRLPEVSPHCSARRAVLREALGGSLLCSLASVMALNMPHVRCLLAVTTLRPVCSLTVVRLNAVAYLECFIWTLTLT